MQPRANQDAFRVALLYVVVTGGWFAFSNEWRAGAAGQGLVNAISDFGFGLVTGGFLCWGWRRQSWHWAREMERHHESERELRQAERALRTLSAGNGALVRATSEAMLYADICRMIVEKGGYRMTWVGFPQNDAPKTVRIAAHAGCEEGYLELSKISWSEAEARGRGPTGTAIRTGRISVCNDFQTDPKAAPWRAEAAKRGYASLIVLPLRQSEKTIGVLAIYAAETNAFNPPEVKLLTELADDLAYGIQVLRIRSEHARAEETLRESESRFSKTFHSSPVPVSLSTMETGRILDANDEFLTLLQRSREEVIGHTAFELDMWVEPRQRAALVASLQDQGVVRNVELEIRAQSGQIRVVLWSVEELAIEGERCWLSSGLDITERKQAEKLLRENEVFIRNVLDSLSAHIVVLDERGVIVAVNQAWRRFASENGGDGARVMVGANYLSACQQGLDSQGSDNAAEALGGLRAVLRGRQASFDIEYPCHAPGAQRWFSMHVWPLEGNGKGVVVAHEDITGRKLAEEQIKLQFSALTAAANAIIITDRKGIIEWVNPAFTTLTGYGSGEAIGASPRLLKSGRHAPEFYAELWRTIAAGQVWHGELVNKSKGGRLYTEDTTITPVRGADGQIAHFIAIKQDVTLRRQLEDQLRQSQKMEAIGQLAGGVAHDFNNMLSALLMQTDLMEMANSLPAEVVAGLRQIREDTNRAAQLTRQLLLFSRRQVMQRQVLDVNEIVTQLTKLLQRIIGEDVRLQLQTHPSPLLIQADAGMIEQVLLNLAVNARDAMPGGGELRIETAEKIILEQASDQPEAVPGRHACLSVSDTGSGIPPEILPQIFEPFFTTKEPGKGTGLGLATVFGIVKQHQGWIEVDNRPGQGVTFRILLPASTMKPAVTRPSEPKPKLVGGKETILVVEDAPAVRRSLRDILERYGYVVLTAANGAEALALWQSQGQGRVALLLTDIVMPGGMSGNDLACQLQRSQPNLKIVYISGYCAETAGRELQLRPGENFIEKPFVTKQLLETVRRSLDG